MAVLMGDVAKKAGVSITTVSHVMNGTRAVALATRRRVLQAVEELRYYKNTSARLLVRGSSDLIGIIISDIQNPFVPPLVKSFEAAVMRANLELLLGMTDYEPAKAAAAVRRMIESRVRGVAVMTSQFEPHLLQTLAAADIPVVALDLPKVGKGRSSVTLDYSPGVEKAVLHLRHHGHREVAIIHGPLRLVSARRYYDHMRAILLGAGMTITAAAEGDNQAESGAICLETLWHRGHRPTAVLCGNDLMAIGVLGAAARLGISVPGQLSIIGSDDIAMASYSNPPLSTVSVPRDAMGYEAFRLLERMCGPAGKRGTQAVLPADFVPRGSTGECFQSTGSTRANRGPRLVQRVASQKG